MRAEIAYVHIARTLEEVARGRYQIWLYDVAADSATYQAAGLAPAWSPDGDSLLFVANQSVYAIGRVTHAVTALAAFGEITSVAWSPTAPLIAISSTYGLTGGFHIFLVSLPDGLPRDITPPTAGSWYQPRFNPTGDRIVHARPLPNIGTEIFTMDTTGANGVRLTNNLDNDWDGCWSPDGTQIAYTHGSEVWIMNANGANNHRLLSMAGEPSWSPDGQHLVVTRYLANMPSLWTVASDGSAPQPVLGLP